MPAIDVMFPYYGDVELMKQAARSVMSQQFEDWRLVVIDDGYPDPEPRRWFDSITDQRVSYQRNDRNLGANGNYRKALELVEAPLVVIMGADDVMLPNYLQTIASDFEAHPEATMVQPGVQVIDEAGRAAMPLVDWVKKAYSPRTVGPMVLKGERLATSLLHAGWHYFPSIAWRSDVIKHVGFRINYDVVQDLALLLDVAAEGGALVVDPRLAFLYRRHSMSDSSVRALDGRRFDEERRFFKEEAKRFAAMGWTKAARAAVLHETSRLNAASLLLQAISKGKTSSLRRLFRHIVG